MLVALIVSAGDAGELECADVACAFYVRAGAKIDEVATTIERNFFVGRNVFDDVDLKLARLIAIAQPGEPAFLSQVERFITRNFRFLERMVRLDLLFHLLLNSREIFGRDSVRQVDVVIKPVLDGRSGGKLRLGPQSQDGRRHDVGAGVPKPFQLAHPIPLVDGFAFRVHRKCDPV